MTGSALRHIVRTFLLTKPRARTLFAVPSVFHAYLLRLISLQTLTAFRDFCHLNNTTEYRFTFLIPRDKKLSNKANKHTTRDSHEQTNKHTTHDSHEQTNKHTTHDSHEQTNELTCSFFILCVKFCAARMQATFRRICPHHKQS